MKISKHKKINQPDYLRIDMFVCVFAGLMASWWLFEALCVIPTGPANQFGCALLFGFIGVMIGYLFFGFARIVIHDQVRATWPLGGIFVGIRFFSIGAAQCSPGGLLRPPRFSF